MVNGIEDFEDYVPSSLEDSYEWDAKLILLWHLEAWKYEQFYDMFWLIENKMSDISKYIWMDDLKRRKLFNIISSNFSDFFTFVWDKWSQIFQYNNHVCKIQFDLFNETVSLIFNNYGKFIIVCQSPDFVLTKIKLKNDWLLEERFDWERSEYCLESYLEICSHVLDKIGAILDSLSLNEVTGIWKVVWLICLIKIKVVLYIFYCSIRSQNIL